MKKTLVLIIISVVVSILMSKLMFSQYDSTSSIMLSNNDTEEYFLIQLGAYSNYDSMITNSTKLNNYIYLNEDNMFYVFGCITKNENNLDKIEGFYKDNGYNTYRKSYNLSNQSLNEEIGKIDLILNETNDPNSIKELCSQGLNVYKEEE